MAYKMVKLSDLVENYDRKRKPLSSIEREQKKGEYPYYGATSVMDYVDDFLFDGKYLLFAEDGTVMNEDGTPVLQIAEGRFWVNNHAHVLKNTEIVDFDYLYYLLKNTKVNSIVTGAVQLKISQANMNNMELMIEDDLTVQKKIAEVLVAIDEKIRVNNDILNNLLNQARALYKNWFVDYERFSSDGELPDGWRLGTAGEILEFYDSKRVPLSGPERAKREKIYPYYGAASLMDYVDDYLFDGIYLLIGEDGTVTTDSGTAVLQYVFGKFWVNNHAHIVTGKLGYTVEELLLLFDQANIMHLVTGAVQKKISQANLKKLSVVIAPIEVHREFNSLIQPYFEKIRNIRSQNQRWEEFRDSIMPKLLNGELSVDEIRIE